ncbi:hypothetical protein [Haloarcula salinisoli]|uniref:Uncharacterized protein n=1 Tax=Haloarcula salinisoli TaxID=2487746 RepID=A0A8J7YJ01_9EURY|nr:hypothetical protein [Halomicroarcula salinisoli]MBX0286899.1 hypothetical protein [Halomicroarcula salinisoli]MBX0304201.1 hypothetical protein [Halomicroarcula salinisoli]
MAVEYDDLSDDAKESLLADLEGRMKDPQFDSTRRGVLQAGGVGLASLFGVGSARADSPALSDGENEAPSMAMPDAERLATGHVVAVTTNERVVVDPREYADSGQAIQAANDKLLETMDGEEYGTVVIPAEGPDGNAHHVSETVAFGGTGSNVILPQGWGFGDPSAGIQCDIDDGSPMFRVDGETENLTARSCQGLPFGNFTVHGNGNDAECVRLRYINAFTQRNIQASAFDTDTADGVFVYEGRCYNSVIDEVGYSQAGFHPACPNCVVFTFSNELARERGVDTQKQTPGELKFGTGCSTYAAPDNPLDTVYDQQIDCTGMYYRGRAEGAGGDAMFHVTDGYLTLSGAEIGRVDDLSGDGTHKVLFSGTKLTVDDACQSKTANEHGDCIRIAQGAGQVRIAAFQDSEPAGHSINVAEDGGGSNIYVVPYPSSLRGSVGYPDERWEATRYPDGWQLYRSGKTVIQANETTVLSDWAGGAAESSKLTNLTFEAPEETDVSFQTPPDSDVRFETVRGWSSNNGQQVHAIRETSGQKFYLSWEVHRRAD